MSLNESDTRAKWIDPALHKRGWTGDFIRREETAGTVEIINGKGELLSNGKPTDKPRVRYFTRRTMDRQDRLLHHQSPRRHTLPPADIARLVSAAEPASTKIPTSFDSTERVRT